MAESKRAEAAEGDETVDIPVPPFDAEAYVHKELINTRATVVLALYGLLLGQVGTILSVFMNNPIASLSVFFFGMVGVKGLLGAMGIDISQWDRKTWAGHIAVVFFTWLAAWVLFQNAPFMG